MKNLRYQKKVIHSRKLLLTLLSYFFIVLLLPTIVGSIAYWKSVQLIGDEIQDTKTKMLSQVSHAIDTQLSEIQRLALQTATNYYILDLLSCKNPSDEDTVYKAVHAIREIATLKNANSFIEDIFVYSKNMDCIANANSLYKTDFFFDYSYTYKDIDYTEWISELSEQVNYNTYWPSQNVQVDRKTSHPIITYIQSIPIAERYSPYGCVVILINEDKILSLFEDIAKDGTALVVNSQNEVVTQTENRYSYYPQIEEMPLSQDMIKKNVNFEEIVSLYNTSSITDWKYLSIYSENTFMQKANYIRTFTIILVGLGLLLGMIAAYFLSKKVYSPIGSLFAMLLQNSKVHYESDDKENEMEFIHHAVSQTLKENRSLTLEIQKHSSLYEQNLPYLKNVLLLKLLNHLGKQQEEWYTYLKSVGIIFPYDQFSVILYHVDNCTDFIEENLDREWELVRTVISSVAEEMAELPAYTAELCKGDYALLLNLQSDLSAQLAREKIYRIAQESKQFIESRCKIFLSVGVGSPYLGISNISKSYKEADKALEYRMVRGGSVITFDEIESRSENYFYPLDLELQLLNTIKSGDSENCKILLDRIMDENINKRQIPSHLAKCLFFDLMGTAVKLLDRYRIEWKSLFDTPYHPIESIISCDTLDEEIQQIQILYTQICDYIREHQSSRQFRLAESVKEYINQHFSDYDLSQSTIAGEFGITATYLSKFFKQETGENMVDYINRRRITEMKQLLLQTKDPLSVIAEKTGCASDKTLIRLFKVYEGITPGKYRELNQKEQKSQN